MVERLFLVPRLVSPAWHLCLKVSKVYGSDIRGIPGGPEDGREAVLVPCLVIPAWHLCLKVSKVYGSDIRGIPGGPEDGREAVSRPLSGQPSLAPLPEGE